MRKKYLFIEGSRKWNSLVHKFYKLYRRMRMLFENNILIEAEYIRLSKKIKRTYKRLERMQYKVGIRIAGTTLAIMLSASIANAQDFTAQGKLQGISQDISVTYDSDPTFADIDDDGDLDMYVGNQYGEILYYENDGNGIFTAQGKLQADGADIDVGNNASPEFADIDGDGDLDLYIGDSSGKIHIFNNDGSGIFTQNNFLQADGADIVVNTKAKFDFADLDGDNDLDLFIGDYFNDGGTDKYGFIKYYTNNGDGTFTDSGRLNADGSEIRINSFSNIALSPTFADIDKNGNLDLYLVNVINRNIKHYEDDGSGTLSYIGLVQADDVNISANGDCAPVCFADINGDGNEDLFLGTQFGFVDYYKNKGTGVFSYESYLQEPLTGDIKNRYTSPRFADINGNGILDLYTGTLRNSVLFFPNDGNMLFGFHTNVKESNKSIIASFQSNPAFADIDDDNDLDLFIGDENGYIKFYENDGSGVFVFQNNVQADGADIDVGDNSAPVFADIDNDGDLDLFIGNSYGTINFYENNGSGVFTSQGLLQADGSDIDVGIHSSLAVADIDNDGDLDIFAGSNNGNITYYTNNGSGIFSSQGFLQADGTDINVTSYSNPSFADIDNDGDLDLFVGSDLGEIYYFKNLSLTSNAGNDAEVTCSLEYTLNANQPDPGKTGTWTIVAGSGTFDDAHAYNALFSAGSEGNCTLRWSVTDGANTISDDVVISFLPDNTNPTITCVGNQEVTADSNHSYTVSGTEFDPLATDDNCAVASVVNDINSSETLAGATLQEGTTTVQWTVTDDAGNTEACSFDILVNAFVGTQVLNKTDILISPNPVKNILTININNFTGQRNFKIKITDILGKTVSQKDINKGTETFDLSALKKGVYFVNIISRNNIYTTKIIKN